MKNLPSPLILAAQKGDQAAISSLLEISQVDIRRYARRSCRASDVDDALQETLWLVHRRIGGLRSAMAFSSWLFQIVRRECLRLARLTLSVSTKLEDVDNDARIAATPHHELRLDLAAAIQSLPEHYRTIVLLRDVEELTIDEIAETLNVTRQATKARLHRARKLVKEYLTEA